MDESERASHVVAVHDDLAKHRHDGRGWVVGRCCSGPKTADQFGGFNSCQARGAALGEDIKLQPGREELLVEIERRLFRGRHDMSDGLVYRPSFTPGRGTPLLGRERFQSIGELISL